MADLLRRGLLREQVLICGLGLRLPHITLEAMQALKKCRTVFHDSLDAKTKNYLRGLCRNLKDLGKPGRPKDSETIASAVLAAAAPGRAAALLCSGNPGMFQWDFLVRSCESAGIPYRVIAGVSPLDEILAGLGAPVLGYGLQLYPACAISPVISLLPAAPAVIMSLDQLWESKKAGVSGFVRQLGTVYPSKHRMTLLYRSDLAPALRLKTDLAGLAGALEGLREAGRRSASLFIPPLKQAKKGLFCDGRYDKERARDEQLLICGFGLRFGHLTLETMLELKKCRTVFHNFLTTKTENHVLTLCPDLRDLKKLRRRADDGAEAEAVIAAVAKGHTVAYLGYGHPLVMQGTADALLRRCLAENIPYRVITSLSSLDEILIAAGPIAIKDGVHICPSNELAGFPLSPRIPAIVMGLNHLWDFTGTGVAGLVKHLNAIYPQEHRILLIHCSQTAGDPPLRLETPLRALAGALESFSEADRFTVSMFIPALGACPA